MKNASIAFNKSERVTVDGNLTVCIPDGYKYAKDGYGGNQHWFYIVPENYSLDLDHIEAKPLSFGIAVPPIDISATVDKDAIDNCKTFLIQNNALDPSVAIYDLVCSEHCFFIFQRWFDSNDNLYNKINGFIFAKNLMYQFHTFMNHDRSVSDDIDVIRNFDLISRQWMKHVALSGDNSYKAKGDPEEVKATLDDLSRMFVMAKEKMLPTLSDDLGSNLRKTYALIAGMFYSKNNMQITPARAQSVSNMVGMIDGQEVSKDYLLNLISEYGGKSRSITDVIRGFEHDRALKALVTMDKLSNAGIEGGLAMVHFVGVQLLLKTLCADNKVDYDVDAFSLECIESLRTLFSEKWNETDAYMMNDSTLVIRQTDSAPSSSYSSSQKSSSKPSVLTEEQQRQKDELDRQMEELKSQAAYYSSQNLSAEDRETLAETKKEIEKLSKQVDGISSDQAKFEEHLRQKEEQKKKAEEEKARRRAEILAKGNTDDVAVDMFVILTNEKGLGKLNRNQTDFCRIYDEDFPTLNKKEMASMRKEIREKMKDADFCEVFTEKFKERSVKDRFSVSTRNYYNVNTGDFGKKVEEAIDGTACWYSRQEFKEVRTLMEKHLRDTRKKLDDQLAPVEQGWTKFNTARKDLAIVIKDDAEINENNECFQVRTGGALVEVNLITGGLLKLSVTLMNCFPWYWDKEVTEIWEAALKNEVRDESTGWFDNDRLAQQAAREIRKKYPPEKEYYRSKGTRFIQEIVKMYEQADPLSNPVKAVKDIMKSIFPKAQDFADSRNSIAESSSLNRIPGLKEFMDSGIPSAMAYEEIPEIVGSEIADNNKRKIEAKKSRDIQETKNSLSDETLFGLAKSISLLQHLKEYDDADNFKFDGKGIDELIKQCSEKIGILEATQYQEALKLIEEGTEESLSKAEKMLSELSSYKDAEEKAKEARSLCEKERRYITAKSMAEKNDLGLVKKAEEAFKELGAYKDSEEKASACSTRIEQIKKEKLEKAMALDAEGTIDSIRKAISTLQDAEVHLAKVSEFKKHLDQETKYVDAVSKMKSDLVESIVAAIELLDSLDGYKDAEELRDKCQGILDSKLEEYNGKAQDLLSSIDYQVLSEVEKIYKKLRTIDYDDEWLAAYESRLDSISNLRELYAELSSLNEEHATLGGLFKRKQRLEVEGKMQAAKDKVKEIWESLSEEITVSK